MLSLLLMRHAESIGNQQGRMQGHQPFELSERGWEQAQCLAQRLATQFAPPHCLYASPLLRAKQTVQVVLKYQPPSVTVSYDSDLAEGHQGIFEGLTWAEALGRYPDLCHRLETTSALIAVPGAETPVQMRQRAQRWLQGLWPNHQDGDRIWVVAHEWILDHLISVLLGSDRTWQFPISHTGLFEFVIDHPSQSTPPCSPEDLANSCRWQVRRFNDSQHFITRDTLCNNN